MRLTRFLLTSIVVLSTTFSTVIYATPQCPRIISQSPYISEMLDYLGMGQCIVGVSRYSKRDLPHTGGILDPDADAIETLSPDLIITSDWAKKETMEKVTPDGAKVIRLKSFNKMDQLENNMSLIVETTKWEQVHPLVKNFSETWREKVKQVKGNNKKVLLLSSCSGSPYSFGPNSRLHYLFTLAGFYVVETKEKIRHIRAGDEIENLTMLADKYHPDLLIIFEQKLKKQCQMITPSVPVKIVTLDGDKFLHPNIKILKGLDLLISKKHYWN